jgi:DNA repair photolyase
MILKSFDPWKNPLCTCPAKLSLNPYTGCAHGCLYCYASSYIPLFWQCRPKKDLIRRLHREAKKIKTGTLVSMSNSSDPYPPLEKELELSRGCLLVLKEMGLSVQMVTKSDIIVRDADILENMPSVISMTITTLSDALSRKLEPGCPLPGRRLYAIRALRDRGIPVSVRLDPLLPGINDQEVEDVVEAAFRAGALHITSSTYKARPDSWKRICSAFPEESIALGRIFERGERIGGSLYLPRNLREDLIVRVERATLREGLTFSSCREGLPTKGFASCDGSHLIVV